MPDTIDAVLRHHAAIDPLKDAVIDPADRVSYGHLDVDTRELAAAFVTAGIGKGTRVGLLLPNGVAWARIALALMRTGAVLVPLSTLLQPPELVAQLRVASVRFLITVEEFRGHRYLDDLHGHTSGLPALHRVWTTADISRLSVDERARDVSVALAAAVDPSDPMAIVFTSGSSGSPKGILHSHGSALGAVQSSLGPRCIGPDTRLYLPMPLFWVGGLGGGLLSALHAGATLVTEPRPRPPSTLKLLARERVTLFRGWPDQAEALARHPDFADTDLSALRQGSLEALLPPSARSAQGARATLFGMTETFGPYCGFAADTDMPRSAWGSCGKPFAGMEIRIADVESHQAVDTDEIGEVHVRGPHTLRGVCRRSREEVFTADGYYPTGDLGRLDRDGFLFFHGRVDDMFKVSGATVYPGEVEGALRTLDGVTAAYVTNVPGVGGARVGAVVVTRRTSEALRTAARRMLSSFKVPTVWLLVGSDDDVPRGATGKVDVRRVREMLAAADQPTTT